MAARRTWIEFGASALLAVVAIVACVFAVSAIGWTPVTPGAFEVIAMAWCTAVVLVFNLEE